MFLVLTIYYSYIFVLGLNKNSPQLLLPFIPQYIAYYYLTFLQIMYPASLCCSCAGRPRILS